MLIEKIRNFEYNPIQVASGGIVRAVYILLCADGFLYIFFFF
jgi:hypothetical protein